MAYHAPPGRNCRRSVKARTVAFADQVAPITFNRPQARTALTSELLRQVNRPASSVERTFSFGPFRLVPTQRLLLEGEKVLRLGSRALDILIALVERPGELVSKGELMARVWPNAFVEPANLTVHVSSLRRALGDGRGGNRYLINTPGQGYRFVAPVEISEEPKPSTCPALSTERVHNLPASLTRLIGRADIVSRLVAQLSRQRFLTIVGPGGIGKTSVALAMAEGLIGNYEHGVWLIDLAPLGDPMLVPTALASAAGLEIRSEMPLPGLIAVLRDRQMLLVLDNCEHVIEAAAVSVAEILRETTSVQILATSREPLCAQGEGVHRLSPLESPPASVRLSAFEALRFPAVQLFVERAAATMSDFELSDADVPVVAEICSKLDGIPLAIEFAAARVEVLGVRGLAARLADPFRVLTSGCRRTLFRHHTMRATLDWSYELLPECERAVLRRIAVCAGGFTAEAASVVATDEVSASDVVDCVANLATKSLVAADLFGSTVRYRMPETTRAYALEKLKQSGEFEQVARRHAEYYRDVFERAEAELETRPTIEWLADYRRWIDNVRAALDWTFSPSGDPSVGVALTAASVPLWLKLSLMDECRGRVERALSSVHSGYSRGTRREMQLYAALGAALMFTEASGPEIWAAWASALRLLRSLMTPNSNCERCGAFGPIGSAPATIAACQHSRKSSAALPPKQL